MLYQAIGTELNITAAITNNGTYNPVLTTSENNLTQLYSRDQANPDWLLGPDLVVVTARDYSWAAYASDNWVRRQARSNKGRCEGLHSQVTVNAVLN